jgi:hypothetical protein
MPFTDMQNMYINMTNDMSSPASICLVWRVYIFDISVTGIMVICTDPTSLMYIPVQERYISTDRYTPVRTEYAPE